MVDTAYEMWVIIGVVMTIVLPVSAIIIAKISSDHYKDIALEREKTKQLEFQEKIVNGRPSKTRKLRAADEEV